MFNLNTERKPAGASSLSLRRTRWLFFSLCCYLLSQGFTIPILAIGPSWAMWPTISDFAAGLLVLTFLLNSRHTPAASRAKSTIFFILIIICFGSMLSFTWNLTWVTAEDAKGGSFGIYEIYRLVQFTCIFWVTARIPLTPERINVLRRIIEVVLIFACAGIVVTYFSIFPPSVLVAHLPQNPYIAGPWNRYVSYEGLEKIGWGTIGYNHGYVAAQVFMLIILKIHLGLSKKVFSDNIFLFMSIFACFLSESRTGLLTIILFAITCWSKKPKYAVLAAMVALIAGVTTLIIKPDTGDSTSAEASTFERQETLLAAGNTENLSGRDEIWMDRISFLDEEPMRWFVGSGFGSAIDSGTNAHMLPLQIVLETGLVGLLIFVVLFYKILDYLYKYETGLKPIFWGTVALLVSSLTQETFYPVPSMVHFTGFYLCSLAIALQQKFPQTT